MIDCSGNRFQNTSPVRHHVMIVEAQHAITLVRQKRIATGIVSLLSGFEVLAAIEFDNQLCAVAKEVHDIRTDWRLAAKTRTIQAMRAQRIPDDAFSVS